MKRENPDNCNPAFLLGAKHKKFSFKNHLQTERTRGDFILHLLLWCSRTRSILITPRRQTQVFHQHDAALPEPNKTPKSDKNLDLEVTPSPIALLQGISRGCSLSWAPEELRGEPWR